MTAPSDDVRSAELVDVRPDGGHQPETPVPLFDDETLLHDVTPSWSHWGNLILFGIATVPMLVGVFVLLFVYFRKRTTKYYVTQYRVLERTGILGVRTVEYRIQDVNWMYTGQNWLGTFTGKGDVGLGVSGNSTEIGGIPDAERVANTIRKRRAALE